MHNRAMNTPIAWPSAEQVIDETRHWMLQAVIGLNLCPFAKAVHVKNQIRYVVSEATTPEELAHDLIEELQFLNQADPQEVDTTLLIHPQTLNDFLDYNDFLDVADAAVTELDLEGILQVASFHPQFQFKDTEPDDIENYTNRSPFPILHLLREESISRVVDAVDDADAIYERNVELLRKLGREGWEALWRDNADSGSVSDR